MSELISVIVPVYNVEKYLRKCIDSIINQTYRNLEIILVDDGSPDNCGAICDEYAAEDSRVKVIHKKNEGVSVARNEGLEKSNGELIIFIDPDDFIENEMLADMHDNIIKYNVDVVCCGYFIEKLDEMIRKYPNRGIFSSNELIEKLFSMEVFSVIWNKMFKKSVLLDNKNKYIQFPIGIYMGEDVLWLTRVLKRCKEGYCIDKCYYHWIRREESATGSLDTKIDSKVLSELYAYKCIYEENRNNFKLCSFIVNKRLITVKSYINIARKNHQKELELKLNNILREELKRQKVTNIKEFFGKIKWYIIFLMIKFSQYQEK